MNEEKIKAIIASVRDLDESERIKVLEELRELFCLKCGAEGPQRHCYCDYVTPLD